MYIIDYKEFINKIYEVKLADVLKITSNSGSNFENILKSIPKSGFDDSDRLNNFVNVYINGIRTKLKVSYYDKPDHNIIKRIKRTDIKSIKDFNIYFAYIIRSIITSQLGKDIDKKARYVIFDEGSIHSLIVNIDPDKIKNGERAIKLITIIPGKAGGQDYYKMLKVSL